MNNYDTHDNGVPTPMSDESRSRSLILSTLSQYVPQDVYNVRNSKFVWCTDYADDIFQTLKEAELKRKMVEYKIINHSYRITMLKLIKNVSENLELGRTTVHLAVFMLDCMLDYYTISNRTVPLVAMICLLLACKIDECDRKIPRFTDLCRFLPNEYRIEEFLLVETLILKFFDWYIMFPTAATFLESCAHKVVTLEDFRSDIYCTNIDVCAIANSLVYDYLDASLYDRRFVCQKPSLVAAACMAATRKVMEIEPIWSQRIADLTEYSEHIVMEYAHALIVLKDLLCRNRKRFQQNTPDSGYKSNSNSDSESETIDNPSSSKKKRTI